MNKKLVFFTILLLLAAGVTTWLSLQSVKKSTKYHISKPHNPDAFAINATFVQMDNNGHINDIIYSPKLIHYPYQNSAVFQQPVITIINPNTKPYHITAKYGHSTYGTKIINLLGNVKLHQPAGPNNKALTITTSAATFYSQKKYITTDQFVTIHQPGLTTTAIGASDDLNKKIIKLHSQVKDIYEPSEYNNVQSSSRKRGSRKAL
jgi:LPS export ABC transporter protein LptC